MISVDLAICERYEDGVGQRARQRRTEADAFRGCNGTKTQEGKLNTLYTYKRKRGNM
jgi:hypothetical protein